jgi:hypothetical protein
MIPLPSPAKRGAFYLDVYHHSLEKTVGQLLAAHRSVLAPPITDFRADVPEELALVIARCLVKAQADRFQSATTVYQAFGAYSGTATTSIEKTIGGVA